MSGIQTWSSGWPMVAVWAGAFAAGALSWSFVEYAIHGLLAHRFRTFVSPLHWGHHRTPAAVFTSPLAWVPVALVLFGVGAAVAGAAPSAAFLAGLLLGFARYERLHWRIHFRAPRNARERRRRDHHLAHHFVNPRAYHGVTTRLWDHVFRTLPGSWRDDYARVSGKPPLRGPSNLRATWNPRAALRVLANARRADPIDASRE